MLINQTKIELNNDMKIINNDIIKTQNDLKEINKKIKILKIKVPIKSEDYNQKDV